MRVLMSSVGRRADGQPLVAPALEMRALGHEVRMCGPPNFTGWTAGLDTDVRPIGVGMREPRPGDVLVEEWL